MAAPDLFPALRLRRRRALFLSREFFMGAFSTTHLLIIMVIAILLFGNRLPGVMRSLGQGIVEFKKGLADVKDQATKELEDKSAETKKEV
jgi:sec-independent protein translocase protein TatA